MSPYPTNLPIVTPETFNNYNLQEGTIVRKDGQLYRMSSASKYFKNRGAGFVWLLGGLVRGPVPPDQRIVTAFLYTEPYVEIDQSQLIGGELYWIAVSGTFTTNKVDEDVILPITNKPLHIKSVADLAKPAPLGMSIEGKHENDQ